MSNWATAQFGEQLVTKSGVQSTSEVLKGKKYIGVYFSAHWYVSSIHTMYQYICSYFDIFDYL
jgi:hypothetical protein